MKPLPWFPGDILDPGDTREVTRFWSLVGTMTYVMHNGGLSLRQKKKTVAEMSAAIVKAVLFSLLSLANLCAAASNAANRRQLYKLCTTYDLTPTVA